LYRFRLDLAIPEAAYLAIPAATKAAFRDRIRAMKALAVKINAGAADEEATITASWHKCNNDTNTPCDPDQDI